jgi:hypothetical protein
MIVHARPRVHPPETRGAGSGRLGARRGTVQTGPAQVDDHQLAEGDRAGERRSTPRTALVPALAPESVAGARPGLCAHGDEACSSGRAPYKWRSSTASPAYAERHSASSATKSRVWLNVCPSFGASLGAGARRSGSRRDRRARRSRRAPPHIRRRRVHIGMFAGRRPQVFCRRVLLVRVRPRVPARACGGYASCWGGESREEEVVGTGWRGEVHGWS